MASLIPIQAADQAAEDEKGWAYDIVIMKFGSFQNAAGERGSNYVFPKEASRIFITRGL